MEGFLLPSSFPSGELVAVEDNMSFAGFFPIFEISQRVLRRAGSEKKKVLFVHAEFIESEVQAIFRKMGIAKAELEHLQCVEAVDPKKPGGHCDLKQLKASIENALAADVGVVVLDDFTTLCRGNSLKAALQFLQFLKQDVVDSERGVVLRVLGSERPSLRVFEGAGSNSPLAPVVDYVLSTSSSIVTTAHLTTGYSKDIHGSVTFALRATLCGSQDSVRSVSKSSVLVKIEDGRTVVYKQSEGPAGRP